jgi:hypothetical protein
MADAIARTSFVVVAVLFGVSASATAANRYGSNPIAS